MIMLDGQRFGRLTVLTEAPRYTRNRAWWCRCDCGRETRAAQFALLDGRRTSCGCKRLDNLRPIPTDFWKGRPRPRQRTHGMTATPEYRSYTSMKQRCF